MRRESSLSTCWQARWSKYHLSSQVALSDLPLPSHTIPTDASLLAGSNRALQNELGGESRVHFLRGVLMWDVVDKQFHVPLVDEPTDGPEERRKFRIDCSPLAMLRCTCVCSVFPVCCWAHGRGGRVAHNVIDISRVTCEHGVSITSPAMCMEAGCAAIHAHRWDVVRTCMQYDEDPIAALPRAAALPSGVGGVGEGEGSSSEPPAVILTATPVEQCAICMTGFVGPPTSHMRERSPQSWGCLKCCRKPMHSACLYKWFNVQRVGRGRISPSCPLCRHAMSGLGLRAWAANVN